MTRTSDLAAAKACLTGLCGAEAPVLAAVSGGLDSMCLLHLLATWGRERNLNVAAAHFNHQLRGAESDRDERFVRDWCGAHEIPFVSGRGDVRALAARKGPASRAAKTPYWLIRVAMRTMMVSESASDSKAPARVMALPTTPMTMRKPCC